MTTAVAPFALAVPAKLVPAGATIRVRGTWDAPLFSIPDTCRALEMTGVNAVRNVVERLGIVPSFHSPEVKTRREGRPSTYAEAYCGEADWFAILLTSDKRAARPLVAWVCGDVLPSIRRHGCYPPPASPAPVVREWTYRFTIRPELNNHRVLLRRTHPGRWTVAVAMLAEMALLEGELIAHGYPLSLSDLPDGSAGQCYANHRRGKPWAMEVVNDVPLVLPAGGGRATPYTTFPKVYRAEERHRFEAWFEEVYAPTNLPDYLKRKAGRMAPDARPAAIEAASRVCDRIAIAGLGGNQLQLYRESA